MTAPALHEAGMIDDASRAVVQCGGELHTIVLDAGRLTLLDHAEVDSERVLAALGGAVPTCVQVLQFVELARTRAPLWRSLLAAEPLTPSAGPLTSLTPLARAAMRRQVPGLDVDQWIETLALYSVVHELPRSFRNHVGVSMVTDWLERWGALPDRARAHERAEFERIVWIDASAALNRCCPFAMRLDVALTSGEPGIAVGGEPATVTVRLEPRWLIDVWWPGLADVDGSFVLQATVSGDRPTVLAASILDARTLHVRPETAQRIDGHWTLRPSDH